MEIRFVLGDAAGQCGWTTKAVVGPNQQSNSLRIMDGDHAALPVRSLGTTGMEITTVGLGAWAIGGGGWAFGWGPQDFEESVATILEAVRSGINWIDTAAVYGLGTSEKVVGEALRRIGPNERPYVFTKCGLRWDDADRSVPPSRVGNPSSIRQEVDASLSRLGVERIDLYQMHWPTEDGTPLEEYWSTLLELRDAGKVAAIGLSNHSASQLTQAEALGHVDSLQPPLSLINRSALAADIPWCDKHSTGVIVYSPMQSGLLSGTFDRARLESLAPDDWRRRSPDFSGDGLEANLALAEGLRPLAESYGVSVGALAVAWTLSWPGVTGAIVGARRPDQIRGWIDAAGLSLTEKDLASIAALVLETGAGKGPIPGA